MGKHRVTVAAASELVRRYDKLLQRLLRDHRYTARRGWFGALETVTLAMSVKARATAASVLLLVRERLVREGQVLARVLVELTVTLLAIGRKPKERAELFVNFQHITKWQWYDKVQKDAVLRALIDPDSRLQEELRRQYNKHNAAYISKGGKPRRNWHHESRIDLASEVGMKDLWSTMYPIDSAFVHSGPDCLGHYLFHLPGGGLELRERVGVDTVPRLLYDVANSLSRIIEHFLRFFPSDAETHQLERLNRAKDDLFDP